MKPGAIQQVNMSDVLAQQFHMAMLDIYDRASKLKPPYRASRFKIMVNQEGGKAAADKMLASNKVSDGFSELFLRGKDNLRISVEYLVLEPQSRELFTEDQLAVATKRLLEVGCPLPAGK